MPLARHLCSASQTAPWHFLYFLPLPQGHGSLRSTLASGGGGAGASLGGGGWLRFIASKAAVAGGRRVAMRAARSCWAALSCSGVGWATRRARGELGSPVKPGGALPLPVAVWAWAGGGPCCTRTRSERLATSSSIAIMSFSKSWKPSALYSFFGS